MHVQEVEGSMYAFPRIDLPDRFLEEAASIGLAADAHYCMKMLETIGLVCVPGSGFK